MGWVFFITGERHAFWVPELLVQDAANRILHQAMGDPSVSWSASIIDTSYGIIRKPHRYRLVSCPPGLPPIKGTA